MGCNFMEQTESTEKVYRINFSQIANGTWKGEYTARADTIEELTQRVTELRALAEEQLKILNGKVE